MMIQRDVLERWLTARHGWWTTTVATIVRFPVLGAIIFISYVCDLTAHQQPHAGAASQVTVKQAEAAIDKAAAERKVPLSDAAKTAMAVEVVRQDATKPSNSPSSPTADARAQEVVGSIAEHAPAGKVTAEEAHVLITDSKAQHVLSTLDREAVAHAAAAGKILNEDAKALVVADLEKQTKALAGSGLSVETIKSRNEAYVVALSKLLPDQATVTRDIYQEARRALFTHFVQLTIDSVPAGARVNMEGAEIGTTSIATQVVEPGKSYRFEFNLAGYHSPPRQVYVPPAPDTQTVSEVLTPDVVGGPGPLKASGPSGRESIPEERSSRRFVTVIYIGAAVVGLAVGIVLLMRLKS